jgi:hypothetical protein
MIIAKIETFPLRIPLKPGTRAAASSWGGQLLASSIKEEVKKKHFSFGWNFSCFSAHMIERDLF